MRKHIITTLITYLLFFSFIGQSKAQQTPVFTEYNYNPFIINPAYAGATGDVEAVLANSGFSNQLAGAPENISFTFNTDLYKGRMGVGAGIINDKIGVNSSTQIFGAYAYKIYLNENAHPYWKVYDRSFISFGLTAGALLYNEDLLQLGIQNDPNFSENINATLPAAGAGILFGYSNFFAGVAIPNLLGDTFSNQEGLELSRPVYAYTGYYFATNRYDPKVILKPSLLLKYEDGAPFQLDANLSMSFMNILEIGAGYRTTSAINFAAGFCLFKNFRVLYNYTRNGSDNPLGNTHGIVISYRGGNGYNSY